MTILGNGYVGIGTTSPLSALHLGGSPQDIANSAELDIVAYRATASPTATDKAFGFYTGSGFTHLMSILNNGNVGIGTTTPTAQKLVVAGNIRVGTDTTGCIEDADGTVLAGTCSSDERLKKNITPFSSVLDRLVQLTPVTYNWRSDEFPERYWGDALQTGLIAQDVEEQFPELVVTDDNGFKQIAFHNLPFYMLQGIKEMNLKVMDINNFEEENNWRDSLSSWFANAENRITRIFTGEVCLSEAGQEPVCINRAELQSLKALLNNSSTNTTTTSVIDPILTEEEAGGGGSSVSDPTCSDGVKNQDETDIDVGGVCIPTEDPEVLPEITDGETPEPDTTTEVEKVVPSTDKEVEQITNGDKTTL